MSASHARSVAERVCLRGPDGQVVALGTPAQVPTEQGQHFAAPQEPEERSEAGRPKHEVVIIYRKE